MGDAAEEDMATRMDANLGKTSSDFDRLDTDASPATRTTTNRSFPPMGSREPKWRSEEDVGGHIVPASFAYGGASSALHAPPALSSMALGVLAVAAIVAGIFMMISPFLFVMSLTAAVVLGVVGAWFAAAGIAFVFTKRPEGI
jgi:hypothetical protein